MVCRVDFAFIGLEIHRLAEGHAAHGGGQPLHDRWAAAHPRNTQEILSWIESTHGVA
jgi:hypothetical protein